MPETSIYHDKELFLKIASGDEPAFRQLFHRYNRELQPFVRKLTRSDHAAEEVLQEVFLKIWLYRSKLPFVEDPRAYIIRIAANESLNYLKKAIRQHRLTRSFASQPQAVNPTPEHIFAHRETEKLVYQVVAQLPPACQEVYLLSREQDQRIPEIAAGLQLSDSTVKNQLVKALKVIRMHLAKTTPLLLLILLSALFDQH